jgi:glycosyltransferase involved in cell wall biosynthesis
MARVAWDIAQLVRGRGHQVAMLAARQDAVATADLREAEGIRIARYPRARLAALDPRRAPRTVAAAAAAARELLGEPWDVVHLHSLFTAAGAIAAFGDQPRYVATVHSPAGLEARTNWARGRLLGRLKLLAGARVIDRYEHEILAKCETIHVLSEFTRGLLQSIHGVGERTVVIPHWHRRELARTHTRAAARDALGWPPHAPTFFTVRYHGVRQGLDVAIEALAPLCAERDVRFVLAGDGPRRRALERLAHNRGGEGRILFPGRLDERELSLAYEAADLFVLPTLALECFGLITQEALAFGCPVLGTDAGAIPEVLEPILPQLIVPAGDPDALRARAEDFLDGRLALPPERDLVAYVRDRFDGAKLAPRLLDLIEGSEG